MKTEGLSIAELVQLADEARREWAWYQAKAEQAAKNEMEWANKRSDALKTAAEHSAQLDRCVAEIQWRKR